MQRKELPGALEAWESLSTAVALTNATGVVLWINPATEALLGRPRRSVLGHPVSEFLPEMAMWFGENRALDACASVESAVLYGVNPAGYPEGLRVRAALSPVSPKLVQSLASLGSVYGLLEMTPLDESLQMERDALSSTWFEANRDLLRNLAHEIKNPLGGIRGAAQLLDLDLTDEGDKACTAIIIEEADRLQGLVDRFLVPYRTSVQEEMVNIHEVLESVRALVTLEFTDQLQFERDFDISAPDVKADKHRLKQVFLNLVRNAAQALSTVEPAGGRVISLRTRLVRDVLTGTNRVRRALSVRVSDNGPGIAPEMQSKIFYPLVTGRPEGTGLGLSIVQSFVHQCGGTITLESVPGATTFEVLLPLPEPKTRRPSSPGARHGL